MAAAGGGAKGEGRFAKSWLKQVLENGKALSSFGYSTL
jgi:hypothetical protein